MLRQVLHGVGLAVVLVVAAVLVTMSHRAPSAELIAERVPHQDPAPEPVSEPPAGLQPVVTPSVTPVVSPAPVVPQTPAPGPLRAVVTAAVVSAEKEKAPAPPSPMKGPSEPERPASASEPLPVTQDTARAPAGGILGAWRSTVVSYYAYARPRMCYDPGGRAVPVPPGLAVWTAHKELPCGTWVEITGPAGSVRLQVFDRGPFIAGRALDLSPAAFRAVVGSLGAGVGAVRYRVVAP